ncbi:sensor histidine kinase [Phenylobacterium sp.]|uniref:sensor histidine kinase n=1 Tax=Phenylobacterium sp. TaxID=1871053 RepID=UPI003D26E928
MWWVWAEPIEGGRLRSTVGEALRYAAVLPIVALTTTVAEVFYRLTGSDRLSSIFLAGVLLAAFLLGSGPAYAAATALFAAYMFLVDPRYQFTFGGVDDFNVLMVFLAVAALTGLLAGRMRDEARAAQARQRVNGALLDATQAFSASSDERLICEELGSHLARAARGFAVVRVGEATSGADVLAGEPALAQAMTSLQTAVGQAGAWRLRCLGTGDEALGVAAWRPAGEPLSDEEATLIEILADTGAAALSRARLAAAKSEAEARARTEDLRNALLSSISHDLRTPLAAILASATSLETFGPQFDAATREDLAATIREEAERLDGVVENLLNMSRLEAGALNLSLVAFDLAESVQRTVERRRPITFRTVSVMASPKLPDAMGDPVLFEQALGNVLDNALRYSPPETPVGVVLRAEARGLVVEVWDEGGGVPEADLGRVFEKFYRAPAVARTPGTGLGLAIVRGLLEAMGGQADASNRCDGVAGLVVRLRLAAV